MLRRESIMRSALATSRLPGPDEKKVLLGVLNKELSPNHESAGANTNRPKDHGGMDDRLAHDPESGRNDHPRMTD